jgi:hypothetical protein
MNGGSAVGIATGCGLDGRVVGVLVPVPFHFSISSRPVVGSTQPPFHWVPGALSLGVKRQGREADHSPPTSAENKKTLNKNLYTRSPICLHDVVLN